MTVSIYIALSLIIVFVILIMSFAFELLKVMENRKARISFNNDLRYALTNNVILTWSQVKILAETNNLAKREIIVNIKLLISKILSGKSKINKDKVTTLEAYIDNYLQEEPFEEIPIEIRIHFERLKDNLNIHIKDLEPLRDHIVELVKIKNKESVIQKFISFISLFIGIIGLTIAICQVFVWE